MKKALFFILLFFVFAYDTQAQQGFVDSQVEQQGRKLMSEISPNTGKNLSTEDLDWERRNGYYTITMKAVWEAKQRGADSDYKTFVVKGTLNVSSDGTRSEFKESYRNEAAKGAYTSGDAVKEGVGVAVGAAILYGILFGNDNDSDSKEYVAPGKVKLWNNSSNDTVYYRLSCSTSQYASYNEESLASSTETEYYTCGSGSESIFIKLSGSYYELKPGNAYKISGGQVMGY